MTKHRLQLDDDYSFLAFGLSCHLKDYRVAWLMNNNLGLNLVRQSIQLETKPGHLEDFTKFHFSDEDSKLNYTLLSNQNEDSYLLKQHKQYDYFILVEGFIDIFDEASFMYKLQHIEAFQFIGEMDTEIFHKLQYALFEE